MIKFLSKLSLPLVLTFLPLCALAGVTVTINESDYGKIVVYNGLNSVKSGDTVDKGSDLNIVVTAINDYQIQSVTINNDEQDLSSPAAIDEGDTGKVDDVTKLIGNPSVTIDLTATQDIVIDASYEKLDYTALTLATSKSRYEASTKTWGQRGLTSITLTNSKNETLTLKDIIKTLSTDSIQNDNLIYRATKVYYDCTDVDTYGTIDIYEGESNSFSVEGTGGWLHSYLYIDYNNDGLFTPSLNETTHTVNDESELETFNRYNYLPNDTLNTVPFYDSLGNEYYVVDGSNGGYAPITYTLPDFIVPDIVAPGQCRARYVLGWNTIDATGKSVTGSTDDTLRGDLAKQGGVIIDFTVNIIRTPRSVTVQSQTIGDEDLATIAIGDTDELTVENSEAVRILATSKNAEAQFIGWVDDDDNVVSDSELYTYTGLSDVTLTATYGFPVQLNSTSGGTAIVAGGKPTYTTNVTPLVVKNTRTGKALSTDGIAVDDDSAEEASTTDITITNSGTEVYPAGTKLYINLKAESNGLKNHSDYRIVYLYVNDILYAYATDTETDSQYTTELSMEIEVTEPTYITATFWDRTTGVEDIAVDAADTPAEYFNLQGIRVDADNLTPGLYILRRGNTTIKVSKK
jgi:hypothetical protein